LAGIDHFAKDDAQEAFEERAAIMEFNGGMAREEAEQYAPWPRAILSEGES
jgi:hypothetical protein